MAAAIHAPSGCERSRRISTVGGNSEAICSDCTHPSLTANQTLHDASEQGQFRDHAREQRLK